MEVYIRHPLQDNHLVHILFYHNIAIVVMLIYLWILVNHNQKKICFILKSK